MPTPTGRPSSQFWTETNSSTKYRTLTPVRSRVGDRGDSRPRQLGARTPGPKGGEGARFLQRDESGSVDSQLAGRAPTRTFHARSQLPAQSGLCLSPLSPRPRETGEEPPEWGRARRGGEAGRAKAPPVPNPARLSGRMAGIRRRAAPAEPSRGAGPALGPEAQRGRLGRRVGARLRSPNGGLRPQGRRPGLAAAWAVAQRRQAKDARAAVRSGSRLPPPPPAPGQGLETGPRGRESKPRGSRTHGCSRRQGTKPQQGQGALVPGKQPIKN